MVKTLCNFNSLYYSYLKLTKRKSQMTEHIERTSVTSSVPNGPDRWEAIGRAKASHRKYSLGRHRLNSIGLQKPIGTVISIENRSL